MVSILVAVRLPGATEMCPWPLIKPTGSNHFCWTTCHAIYPVSCRSLCFRHALPNWTWRQGCYHNHIPAHIANVHSRAVELISVHSVIQVHPAIIHQCIPDAAKVIGYKARRPSEPWQQDCFQQAVCKRRKLVLERCNDWGAENGNAVSSECENQVLWCHYWVKLHRSWKLLSLHLAWLMSGYKLSLFTLWFCIPSRWWPKTCV